MKQANINRLHLRLKGISSPVARSVVAGLGDQILTQLAKQHGLQRAKGSIHINQVDLGSLRVSRDSTASDIRRTIAQAIAGAMRTKTDKQA